MITANFEPLPPNPEHLLNLPVCQFLRKHRNQPPKPHIWKKNPRLIRRNAESRLSKLGGGSKIGGYTMYVLDLDHWAPQ